MLYFMTGKLFMEKKKGDHSIIRTKSELSFSIKDSMCSILREKIQLRVLD